MKFGQQGDIDGLVNDTMNLANAVADNAEPGGKRIKRATVLKLAMSIRRIDHHISQGFPLPMRWQGPRRCV